MLRAMLAKGHRSPVRSLGDVERALGLSVVGMVPDLFDEEERATGLRHLRFRLRSGRRVPGVDHLVVLRRPDSPAAQSFRLLRSNVELCLPSRRSPGSVLLVTSPGRSEGKSTVAANLAVTFAQKHWHTLLVDAHLDQPAVHVLFDIPPDPGLLEMLRRRISPGDLLSRRNDPETPLDIVTGGERAGSSNLMQNVDSFRRCMDSFREHYDLIVIDAPALSGNGGLSALMPFIDLVLLVLRSHWTLVRDASAAVGKVEDEGKEFCGAVLNFARMPRDWNLHASAAPFQKG